MNDIKNFEVFWNTIADKTRLNANGYRVLVDMALYGYCTTQKQFLERRCWKQSSVSNTFKRLYDEKFLICKLEGRKIIYELNEELFEDKRKENKSVVIDIQTFSNVWNTIIEKTELSANSYRVLIDILLYGATSQKDLWERRGWKIAGVSATFRKLYDMNLLLLHEEDGKKIYSANIDFIINESRVEK